MNILDFTLPSSSVKKENMQTEFKDNSINEF